MASETKPDTKSNTQAAYDPDTDESPLVCFCHTVRRQVIVNAIRAGADTIEKIQADTCASTGCGGCQCDVQDILDSEMALKKTG